MNSTRTSCVIRVDGHLDQHWSDRLADLTITHHGDATTTLSGEVADQAQLHGVLAGLRDIGATLRELRTGPPNRVEPALTTPLRTPRLTLRQASVDDVAATWAFRRLASVNEWLTGCPDDLDGYTALFTEPGRLATTVIVELSDGTIIGDFMLRREDGWAQLDVADKAHGTQTELGWVIDPHHQGHGYATEAVNELVRHCFQELGVRRITANCFLDNHTSWRLMERVGMRRETHAVQDSLHRSGRWLDTVGYALLVDEWQPAAVYRLRPTGPDHER